MNVHKKSVQNQDKIGHWKSQKHNNITMFRADDEESCVVLGVPSRNPHKAKKNGIEAWENAKSSKVGGYAVSRVVDNMRLLLLTPFFGSVGLA